VRHGNGLSATALLLGDEPVGVKHVWVLVDLFIAVDGVTVGNDEGALGDKVSVVLVVLVVDVWDAERNDQVPSVYMLA
jgi:hypothetical protein